MESTQVDQKFKALNTISSELFGIIQHLEGTIHPNILKKLENLKELAHTTIKPKLEFENKSWEDNWQALNKMQEENGFMTCWSVSLVKAQDMQKLTPKMSKLTYTSWGETQVHEFEKPTHMTWLEFWKLANEMIKKSGDDHHIFIEGITKSKEQKDAYILQTGS